MNTQQVVADPLLGLAGVAIAGEVDVTSPLVWRAGPGQVPVLSSLSFLPDRNKIVKNETKDLDRRGVKPRGVYDY